MLFMELPRRMIFLGKQEEVKTNKNVTKVYKFQLQKIPFQETG